MHSAGYVDHGHNWQQIADLVGTRSAAQVCAQRASAFLALLQ